MLTRPGYLCTKEELDISETDNPPLFCLGRSESIGLAFVTEAGIISLIAGLLVFSLIFKNVIAHAREPREKWRLIRSPMDVYLLSLFAADVIQALGAVANAKWVSDGKVHVGGWCTAQSIFLEIGSTNVALSSLAIAVHTFVIVWWNRGMNATNVAWIATLFYWGYVTLYTTISGSLLNKGDNAIYRPTLLWCWMGERYLVHRIAGQYVWYWVALLFSLLVYFTLFFWGQGYISPGDKFWKINIHRKMKVKAGAARRHSLNMIFYPLVYACLVLPWSIVRWLGFIQDRQHTGSSRVPTSATISVFFVFALSGIANILLFLLTRPNLLHFRKSITTEFSMASAGSRGNQDFEETRDSIDGGE